VVAFPYEFASDTVDEKPQNPGGSKTARIHIDANGNLTNDGNGKVYAYDAANRLISITQASGVTGFAYDVSANAERVMLYLLP